MAAAAATAKAAEDMVAALDEETLALMEISSAATAAPVAVGAEWETFKENVRPLKRGRDVAKLNHALKAHADPAQRAALLEARKYVAFSTLSPSNWGKKVVVLFGLNFLIWASGEETSCCSNAIYLVYSSFG